MMEDVEGVQAQGHVNVEEEGCPERTRIALYLYCVSGDRKSPALLQSRESTEQQTPTDSPCMDSASHTLGLLLLQVLKALCGPSEWENPNIFMHIQVRKPLLKQLFETKIVDMTISRLGVPG